MNLKYIISNNTNPYENLATEEWLTMHAEDGDITLFLWQNANTVVIGRNQNPWQECNVELMKADDVRLARRISGGGAVYHDLGNLNYTFIARDDFYDIDKQTEVVLQAVRMLGIPAEKNGRNDIVVKCADGTARKFSGNAYYSSGGYNYHHGTIMFNVNYDALTRYLNVPADKLQSKGVASVRSRVINLGELADICTLDNLRDAMVMAAENVYMTEAEKWACPNFINARGLDRLLIKCKSDEWNYGTRIKFNHRIEHRFAWGGVDVQLEVQGSTIKNCRIYSDSLDAHTITAIAALLEDSEYDSNQIRALATNAQARELLNLIADQL